MSGAQRWNALRELISSHGWTALAVSVTAVVARIDGADLELRSFAGRVVSRATTETLDVGARTGLFMSSVALLVASFAATLVALRGLQRITARDTTEVLEGLSVGGCAVWLARAWAVPNAPLVNLFSAALAFALLAGLLDRWVLRASSAPQRGEWTALVGIAAVGVGTLLHERFDRTPLTTRPWLLEWGAGALALGLHCLARLACLRSDESARATAYARLAWAIAPLGWLPLVWVLRDELYLTANGRDWRQLAPAPIECALLAALALWCVWRWRRWTADSSLERALARTAFPAFLVALTCFARYRPTLEPVTDLFEPGNPALFVQQWVDFGRAPFVETFDAHGFSDSFFRFIYAALHEGNGASWPLYDFLGEALSTLFIYVVARRLTDNAFAAAFVAGALPMRTEVFPHYCDLSLVLALVLSWLVRSPSALRWIAFASCSGALFLWRPDMGLASLLASAALLVAWRLTRDEFRPRLAHIALAGLLAAAFFGGGFFAIAHLRGVDALARLEDLRHVLQSSQGFGHTSIASELSPNVLTNLSVVPLALLALAGATLWRLRGLGRAQTSFRELFVVWAVAYYLANFQRGLVRHSWIETGNVYVLSFGLSAMCAAVAIWWRGAERERVAAFLFAASILGGVFGVQGPLPAGADRFMQLWASARMVFLSKQRVAPSGQRIERGTASAESERDHYAQFREFIAAHLSPAQTFVDLQNAPMLYSETRRRSPHYLNHLYLAHDEHLQRSEIAEFGRHDIPLAVVWTEDDLAARDGAEPNRHNVPDALFNHVRQWRLHEWLNARYEPWRLVQRWQVWRRRNWMAPCAPQGEDEQLLARATGPRAPSRDIALVANDAATISLAAERVAYVRLRGRNGAQGEVEVRVEFEGQAAPLVRRLRLPLGAVDHYWTLPPASTAREARRVTFDLGGALHFDASEIALLDVKAPDYTDILPRATRWRALALRWLPWMWGAYDAAQLHLRPPLREVWSLEDHIKLGAKIELSARSEPGFVNGVHSSKAAILVDELDPPLAAGDSVRFAASGDRVVKRVRGREVVFEGAPLDPAGDGRPHGATRLELSAAARKPSRLWFTPLEDRLAPTFLVLEIVAPPRGSRREELTGAIHWGAKDENLGRIDFLLEPGQHNYVLPLANHYNFTRAAVDWFSFHASAPNVLTKHIKLVAE